MLLAHTLKGSSVAAVRESAGRPQTSVFPFSHGNRTAVNYYRLNTHNANYINSYKI